MAIRQRFKAQNTFGARVARLRQRRGKSKSDLAKAVGVSVTCIWNWEEGNTHPRPPALLRLAEALETSPEYLDAGELEGSEADATPDQAQPRCGKSLANVIQEAREIIAAAAELPTTRVRVLLDYGD